MCIHFLADPVYIHIPIVPLNMTDIRLINILVLSHNSFRKGSCASKIKNPERIFLEWRNKNYSCVTAAVGLDTAASALSSSLTDAIFMSTHYLVVPWPPAKNIVPGPHFECPIWEIWCSPRWCSVRSMWHVTASASTSQLSGGIYNTTQRDFHFLFLKTNSVKKKSIWKHI